MENLIHKLLQDFESGKMNRRQLVQSLAMASAAASALAPSASAQGRTLAATGVHHISYQVKDYRKTRDLYKDLLGMRVSDDDGKQCNLWAGTTRIVARNAEKGTPQIDHIAFAIDNWNQAAVEAELKRRNLSMETGENTASFKDPDGYRVQLSPKG